MRTAYQLGQHVAVRVHKGSKSRLYTSATIVRIRKGVMGLRCYTVEVYAPDINRTGRDQRTGSLFWQVTVMDNDIIPTDAEPLRQWQADLQRRSAATAIQVQEVLATMPDFVQQAAERYRRGEAPGTACRL